MRWSIMPCRAIVAWHDRRVPRLRTVTPELPSEIGVQDGLAYCALAAGQAASRARGIVVAARRRLVQGEPPRLRAGGDSARGWPRSRSTSADTATATARSTAARCEDVARDRRAAATRVSATPGADRAARVEHGRLPRARVRRAAAPARGRRDLPGERGGLRRGLAGGPVHVRRPTRRALDAFLAAHDLHDAVAERSRCPSCCCTPRATSRCRSSTRASWRRCARSPGEPADRGAGRPPPLDPARPRAAGGQPAVHPARADALERSAVESAIAAQPAPDRQRRFYLVVEDRQHAGERLGHAVDRLRRPRPTCCSPRPRPSGSRSRPRRRRVLVVRWTVDPRAPPTPPTTLPSVPRTWCTLCCTGWGTAEPVIGLGAGADPQSPAPQVGAPDDATGAGGRPLRRPSGRSEAAPRSSRRVPDPTVRPAPVSACPCPAAPGRAGAAWRGAAAMNASRRATGEMAAEAERGETTTSAGRGLRRDVRPAVEGDQRAGHDEHQRRPGQQRAAGADAGEVRARGTRHRSDPAGRTRTIRHVPRMTHFWDSYSPFTDPVIPRVLRLSELCPALTHSDATPDSRPGCC